MPKRFLFIAAVFLRNWLASLLVILSTNCFIAPASCRAQGMVIGPMADRAKLGNGFHIYSVDISGGYSSLSGPVGIPVASGGLNFDGFSLWASTAIGYTHSSTIEALTLVYTPTFTNVFKYSDRWLDQSLSLNYRRDVTPLWAFRFSGDARDQNIDQLVLNPDVTLPVADGTSGIYAGNPTLASPSLLLGSRLLRVHANTGLTYKPSDRLHVDMNVGGDFEQTREDKAQPIQGLVPRSISGEATATVGYNLTPHLEMGLQGLYLQSEAGTGRYDSITVGGFLGRKIGAHWYLAGMLGAARVGSIGPGNLASGVTIAGNGSLTYKGRENTWSLAYQRAGGDTYGLGAETTSLYTSSWEWRARNRGWGLLGSGTRQQLGGGLSRGVDLWTASFGVTRGLGRQAGLTLSGSYLKEILAPGTLATNEEKAYVARLTFSWIPYLHDTAPLTKPQGPAIP
jgi:hypothetical protein